MMMCSNAVFLTKHGVYSIQHFICTHKHGYRSGKVVLTLDFVDCKIYFVVEL